MRIYNTRFNPTTNGPLHIGHLYMIKINEWMAHAHGGKFIVRFDDNQLFYRYTKTPDELVRIREDMQNDILWAGIKVDKWESQLEMEASTKRYLLEFNGKPLPMKEQFQSRTNPDIRSALTMGYPYAPALTAEKVILDALDYITILIRGEDLISEYSLYLYFCQLWNLAMPEHIYLPRMMLTHDRELGESSEHISKSRGGHTIQELREQGWTLTELEDALKKACLHDPVAGWSLENLKGQPLWKE